MELLQRRQIHICDYASLLQDCRALGDGRRAHSHLAARLWDPPLFLSNHLVSMYGKCGSPREALIVFDKMRERNVVSWTSIITAFAENGDPTAALLLFRRMLAEGVSPNVVTFSATLNACSDHSECLEAGKMIHRCADEAGVLENRAVVVSLANMYSKLGDLDSASALLQMPEVAAWTAVINGFAEQKSSAEAVKLFRRMQLEGVIPNSITLVTVLKSCTGPSDLQTGKLVHSLIAEKNLESDCIVGGALVNMYSNCGSGLPEVQSAFEKIRNPSVVAWTCLISACVRFDECRVALQLISSMETQHVSLDRFVLVPLVNACARLADLSEGRRLHSRIRSDTGIRVDVYLGNALVNMYSKCGSVEEAAQVFHSMKHRDVVTWNTILSSFSNSDRNPSEVFWLFESMQLEGFIPDDASFVAVLNACKVSGSLQRGCSYLELCRDYRIRVNAKHLGCLIDLLGRAGFIAEAEVLVRSMSEPDVMAWMMLLDACRVYSNPEGAKAAAQHVLELDSGNSAAYIMYKASMAN